MNILFLTMAQMLDINNYGIYTDLMRSGNAFDIKDGFDAIHKSWY